MSARSRPAAGEQLWRTLRRYEGPLGDATEPSIVWQRAEGATVGDLLLVLYLLLPTGMLYAIVASNRAAARMRSSHRLMSTRPR